MKKYAFIICLVLVSLLITRSSCLFCENKREIIVLDLNNLPGNFWNYFQQDALLLEEQENSFIKLLNQYDSLFKNEEKIEFEKEKNSLLINLKKIIELKKKKYIFDNNLIQEKKEYQFNDFINSPYAKNKLKKEI